MRTRYYGKKKLEQMKADSVESEFAHGVTDKTSESMTYSGPENFRKKRMRKGADAPR